MRVDLEVNGEAVRVEARPEMPLLWVLRDFVGLTGTKYSCGIGICGACVVHVDGTPARSCVTRIADVAGRSVTTIEGVGEDDLHRVQAAWIEDQVPQCGYCQAGQIMSVTALLDAIPEPSSEDIVTALSGNLCRCGTYPRIRRAVRRLTEPGEP